MKLYFASGACSLAPHIVLHELTLPFEAERVDLSTKRTASGADFHTIHPKGYVPVLVLDDGRRLTECPAILLYLADRAPQAGLAPPVGDFERYRLIEQLNFLATELHKMLGALFLFDLPEDAKNLFRQRAASRLDGLNVLLGGQTHLLGQHFGVADAYLYTILGWTRFVGIDLARWPALSAYQQRLSERPSVRAALRAEGLLRD